MIAFAGLTGAGLGAGLLLLFAGLRGRRPPGDRQQPPPQAQPQPVPHWVMAARARISGPRGVQRLTGRLAAAVVGGVLVGLWTGWPVAALLTVAAVLAVPALTSGVGQQAAGLARIEAVAGWAEMLRDTMAGAAGLEQAITATAPVAPTPIRGPVVTLAATLEAGGRLPAALRAFAEDVADPTCDLVVAALLLAAEHQSRRLADLLGTLAAAAREQAGMRLRTEAGRAATRTSVRVILAATTSLAVGLAVLNRSYLTPYDTALGQLMLLAVGLLFAAAFTWLTRMTRPQLPARLLATTPMSAASAVGVGG